MDFLQSNAAVYSGNQHRSWHATSIQLVQPMPDTTVHSEQSAATRRLFSTVGEATTSSSTEISSRQHTHVKSLSLVKTEPAEKLRSLISQKRQESNCVTTAVH